MDMPSNAELLFVSCEFRVQSVVMEAVRHCFTDLVDPWSAFACCVLCIVFRAVCVACVAFKIYTDMNYFLVQCLLASPKCKFKS